MNRYVKLLAIYFCTLKYSNVTLLLLTSIPKNPWKSLSAQSPSSARNYTFINLIHRIPRPEYSQKHSAFLNFEFLLENFSQFLNHFTCRT